MGDEEAVSFDEGTDDEGLVVDLAGVEEPKYEVMPRGMYNAEVDTLEFNYSQNSGNPMWTWTFRVTDEAAEGRKLFFHTVFKGAGLPRTKQAISRVAPELLEGPFDPQKVADEGNLIGRKVKLRVNISKYQGQDRNNVQDIFAAGDDAAFV